MTTKRRRPVVDPEEPEKPLDPKEAFPDKTPAKRDERVIHGRTETGYTDTTATLAPLTEASAADWLGTNQDPDVMLSVPNIGIDHIGLKVDNLRAHVEVHAKVLDLLELHVGADVSIETVELDIENVRVQAMLKVKLDKVVDIVDRVMQTIDNNPDLLTNLVHGHPEIEYEDEEEQPDG
jgi:hypothetical protein